MQPPGWRLYSAKERTQVIFRSIFNRPQVAQINPDEAHQRQAAGAVIVDVREPDEWRSGHIPGAVHIPLSQLGMHVNRFDKSQEMIVVCRSGNPRLRPPLARWRRRATHT